MTKQTKNAAQVDLANLLADAQAKQAALDAEKAEMEAKLANAAAEAQAAQDAAKAALDEALAPYRASRDELFAGIVDLEAQIAETSEKAKAALEKKLAPFYTEITELRAKVQANEEEATATTGAPAVLLNADIAPAKPATSKKATGSKASSMRKNVRVEDLPVMGPVVITAPHRYPTLDPTNPTTVVYEVVDEDGQKLLCSKRIDKVENGVHVIDEAAQEGPYLHKSPSATKAATYSGWHAVPDVLYALATKAGVLGNFPEYAPASDPADILIDGEPMAEAHATSEALIQETV